MKHNQKNSVLFLIGGIALLIGIVAMVYVKLNTQERPIYELISSGDNLDISTTEWNTYKDIQSSFEISYPKMWEVDTEVSAPAIVQFIDPLHKGKPETDQPSIRVIVFKGAATASEWRNSEFADVPFKLAVVPGGFYLSMSAFDDKSKKIEDDMLATFTLLEPSSSSKTKAEAFLQNAQDDLEMAYKVERKVPVSYKNYIGYKINISQEDLPRIEAYFKAKIGGGANAPAYLATERGYGYENGEIICMSFGLGPVPPPGATPQAWCADKTAAVTPAKEIFATLGSSSTKIAFQAPSTWEVIRNDNLLVIVADPKNTDTVRASISSSTESPEASIRATHSITSSSVGTLKMGPGYVPATYLSGESAVTGKPTRFVIFKSGALYFLIEAPTAEFDRITGSFRFVP